MNIMRNTKMDLSGKDLVQIIKASHKAGVVKIEIGDVKIEFSGEEEVMNSISHQIVKSAPDVDEVDLGEGDITNVEKLPSKFDDEIEDINLMLENPTEWERQATHIGE